MMLTVPDNVDKVMRTLEQRFGRPEMVVQELIVKARGFKPVRQDDMEGLIAFTIAVNNLVATMKTLNSQGHQVNPTLRQKLLEKLPRLNVPTVGRGIEGNATPW